MKKVSYFIALFDPERILFGFLSSLSLSLSVSDVLSRERCDTNNCAIQRDPVSFFTPLQSQDVLLGILSIVVQIWKCEAGATPNFVILDFFTFQVE